MALVCDSSALPNAARCFDSCIPIGLQLSVQTYILAQIAHTVNGSTTDPDTLIGLAQCWESCIGGNSMAVQNYMLANASAPNTSVSDLENAARCWSSCGDGRMPVQTYLLAQFASQLGAISTTDPSALANLASCSFCKIPMGYQMAIQNYLVNQITGADLDPSSIPSAAECFLCNALDQSALRSYLLCQTSNAGLPPCTTPSTPINPTAKVVTNTTIFITWNEINTGSLVTSFTVQWGTTSGVYTNSATVPASPKNYTITGLTAGTQYFFVVKANSSAGCSSANSAEGNATTSGAAPGPCAAGVTYVTGTYLPNVTVNAGTTPSAAVQTALENFYCGLVTDGILNSILWMTITVPTAIGSTVDNAGGKALAKSPFLFPQGTTGTGGVSSPPTVESVGPRLSIQGIRAATYEAPNAEFYNTGFNPSTAFPSAQNAGWFAWVNAPSKSGAIMGGYNVNGLDGFAQYTDGKAYSDIGVIGTNRVTVNPSPGPGFYSGQRVSNVDHRFFFANEATAFAQIGATDAVAWNGAFANLNAYFYALNQNGSLVAPCWDNALCYGFTSGMTQTQVNNLYTRLRTLFLALGVQLSNGLLNGLVSYWSVDTSPGRFQDLVDSNNSNAGGGGVIGGGGKFSGTNFGAGTWGCNPGPANLQLGAGKSFTVSTWTFGDGGGGAPVTGICGQYDNTVPGSAWVLAEPNGSNSIFLNGYTGAGQVTLAGIGALTAAMHHIVFGFDSPNQQLFAHFDGGARQTIACTDLHAVATQILFGGATGLHAFAGTWEQVGFWNRALTAAEVASLYNSNVGLALGGFTT